MRTAPSLLLVGSALLLSGCGGDAGRSDGEAVNADLTVIARDIDFEPAEATVDAGSTTIALDNEGGLRHTFVIEEADGFALEVGGPGDVDRGTVDLEPGEYKAICDVAGHAEAGMTLDLTVR